TNYVANGERRAEAADLNRDGRLDLVLSAGPTTSVGVMLNQGAGAFAAPVYYPSGYFPASATLADFDGDGHLDIGTVVAGGDPNPIVILRGRGDGGFEAPVTVA